MTELATSVSTQRWDALPLTQRRRALGRTVISLVGTAPLDRRDLLPFTTGSPALELATLVTSHRLPGLVAGRLESLGLGGDLTTMLADARREAAAHAFGLTVELAGIAERFSERKIPWMLVKGLALGELAYGDHGLRTTLDLDLVVPPSSFQTALETIESAGGVLRQQNWPLLSRLRLGQIVVRLPLGAYGDLHWHLVNTPEARARFRVPMAELFERRRRVELGPVAVDTLDPVDTVLHLCVHGALSGAHLLVWLKDLERSIHAATAGPEWAWDTLVTRARRYGLGLVAAVMLERSRVTLGAAVPTEVVGALAPKSPLVRFWSTFDRAGTRQWAAGNGTGMTLAGATASSTGSTLVALTRRAQKEVITPRARDAVHRIPWVHLARHQLLTDVRGGAAERRQYFNTVAAEARRSRSWNDEGNRATGAGGTTQEMIR